VQGLRNRYHKAAKAGVVMSDFFSRLFLSSCAFVWRVSISLLLISLCFSCRNSRTLVKLMKQDTATRQVMKNKDEYRLQVIYTKIDRDTSQVPHFTYYKFNVDDKLYFWPASTVKLLSSALALQEFHEPELKDLNFMSPMKVMANGPCQTDEFTDSTAANLKPSIAQYIRRMLLVSDNDAYNRVYDFIGQDRYMKETSERGYARTRVIQRFDASCTPEYNRKHNQFCFPGNDSTCLVLHEAKTSAVNINPVENTEVGRAWWKGDSFIVRPKDFRYNNNFPLADINQVLISLILPEGIDPKQRFNLTDTDYLFLRKYLCMYPYESRYPKYDTSYFPLIKKYLYYGSPKNGMPDSNIRIFNIVGQAYGFMTDAAYIVDFKNNIEFFVTATLYANKDGVLNDNKYEYDAVSFPFMKALGQELHRYELKRRRKVVPDLSRFRPEYLFRAVD
jgi:hypothetical protein